MPPAEDTKNIANFTNYLPSPTDFSYGASPVFTNPKTDVDLAITTKEEHLGLNLVRKVYNNTAWNFEEVPIRGRWAFKTRNSTDDTIRVVA